MTLIWCPIICSRDTGQLFAVERTVVILPVLGTSSLTVVPLHCHSGHQGLSLGSFSYGCLPSHLAPGLGGPLCTEGVNDPGGQLAPLICTHGPSLLASIPCQAECAHLQSLALLAASDPRALHLPPACLLASCSPGARASISPAKLPLCWPVKGELGAGHRTPRTLPTPGRGCGAARSPFQHASQAAGRALPVCSFGNRGPERAKQHLGIDLELNRCAASSPASYLSMPTLGRGCPNKTEFNQSTVNFSCN